MFHEIINKEEDLSKEEIVYLLKLSDKNELHFLYQRADEIRRQFCGDGIHLRGILDFSNYCEQNCLYCSLREENISLERYRMTPEQIIEVVRAASAQGIRTIILQSGKDTYYDTDVIAYILYQIKQSTDLAVTLSLGPRGFDEYKAWKMAGADRYLLKHETANSELFTYFTDGLIRGNERIQHLRFLKRLGFQTGTGSIIGLPNQTIEDIADDLVLSRELDVDMAVFSPFIPSAFTPLQNMQICNFDEAIKTIAVARIVLKNCHLPAVTGLDILNKAGREIALKSGANVLMPNFTPEPFLTKKRLQNFSNKRYPDYTSPQHEISVKLERLGRFLSIDRGDSLKKSHLVK